MRAHGLGRSAGIGSLLALALAAAAAGEPSERPTRVAMAAEPVARAPRAGSLDELLTLVRHGFQIESRENLERLERFRRSRDEQAGLLAEAEETLRRKEGVSQELEERYTGNEQALGAAEGRLSERLGQLGELFGVVRQVATEHGGVVWDSLTSSQLGDRKELLDRLGRSTKLPSTEDLERLWYELQREMTAQGKVARYEADVLTLAGKVERKEVIRAGPFTAVADGKYLLWRPEQQGLVELTRQPPARYLETVAPFARTPKGHATLAVDPSRGSLLNALTDTPSFTERIQQGGYVGYVIIGLGLFAVVLGLARWVVIAIAGRRVAAQRKRDRADPGNPLGRVLGVYEQNENVDPETLELKLDEVVLRESARLERFLWLVRVVSVVAPLLGLLGTVTGMIQTFQAITLFGAGDPKMMAGGISEALVTTMLGLTIAIPLVLLHATLASSTRRITDILDEQSAGLLAMRAERQGDG